MAHPGGKREAVVGECRVRLHTALQVRVPGARRGGKHDSHDKRRCGDYQPVGFRIGLLLSCSPGTHALGAAPFSYHKRNTAGFSVPPRPSIPPIFPLGAGTVMDLWIQIRCRREPGRHGTRSGLSEEVSDPLAREGFSSVVALARPRAGGRAGGRARRPRSAADVELLQDAVDVVLDGGELDRERLGDLLVRERPSSIRRRTSSSRAVSLSSIGSSRGSRASVATRRNSFAAIMKEALAARLRLRPRGRPRSLAGNVPEAPLGKSDHVALDLRDGEGDDLDLGVAATSARTAFEPAGVGMSTRAISGPASSMRRGFLEVLPRRDSLSQLSSPPSDSANASP